MATRRRRRRRRVSAAPRRRYRRRRRRNPVGYANPRRSYRRRSRRRRRSNPRFGMFAMPDLMAVGVGALGGVATPVILGKVFARDPAKVPTWLKGNTGLLVQAAFGVVLGGLIGKFGSRKVGTSFALGASMIPVAQLLAKQGFLAPPVFGESDVSAFDLMGGDYATTMGEVEADEDVLELSGVGADDEAEDLLEMGF